MNEAPEETQELMIPLSTVRKVIAAKLSPFANYRLLPRILLTDAIRDIEFELTHWEELEFRREVEDACSRVAGPRGCSSGSCED